MLIDTSAWIEIFSPEDNVYKTTFRAHVLSKEFVYTCPTIIQEVLQGVRKNDYNRTKTALESAVLLGFPDTFRMAVGAAEIYRQCRSKGITIRKAPDCLIAYYALQYKLPLLHRDRDFDSIATVYPLQIIPV
ncbi:MAG: PIN domain-containing protein [Tunicatimonas sp.]